MHIRSVPEAIGWQADHAREAGAVATARVVTALLAALETDTKTAARMRGWAGLSLEDAMPLRVTGALHSLLLGGKDRRLEPVYRGEERNQAAIDHIVRAMFAAHDAALLPWLDHPPQTNEAGRSAGVMAALKWLSPRIGPNFALNEIGASAGINLMMGRYHYDLGGVEAGPRDSPMQLRPEWRGEAPPASPVAIVSSAGCDQTPIDLTDPEAALRLKSYVWPEITERMARIDAAVRLAGEEKPDLLAADGADWVEARLSAPPPDDTARVFYHTIVWQYLPVDARARITRAITAAGASASAKQPLAWVKIETNRATFRHEIRVRYWPGGGEWQLLGEAHPHGAWVNWQG